MAIRAQLEAQYESEVNRAQQQEVAHRKEIVRILSTHELNGSKTAEMGSGDADALLRGYKEENERLYAKTKGKHTQTMKNRRLFYPRLGNKRNC